MAAMGDGLERTSRYRSKRDAVVTAATELLNVNGVRGFTLADVAQRVGLTTPSVAYYFKKKDDLAAAAVLAAADRYIALVDAARGPTPAARLTAFFDNFFAMRRRIREGQEPAIATFSEVRAFNPPHAQMVADAYFTMFRRIRRLLDPDDEPRAPQKVRTARARLVLEMTYWAAPYLRLLEPEEYARVGQRMADVLIHGLASPTAPFAPIDAPALGAPAGAEAGKATFLVAATHLINEQGYRGASVEKISARLNVTKGSFYHYNEAKDDLVVACFARSKAILREALRRAALEGRSGWERLCFAACALLKFQLSPDGPLLRSTALAALPPTIRYDMVADFDRIADRFAALISDGIADGSIRAVDPLLSAQMFMGMINSSVSLPLWAPDVSAEDLPMLYARPLMTGMFK